MSGYIVQIARFLIALAAAAAGAAVHAQNAPAVIAPLQVEPDRNNVNLHNGRTRIEMPVLSVPGAPNLRFDRLQNAAPYINGRVTSTTATDHDQRSYAVHIGAASSDAFDCYDAECFSVTGAGSTIAWHPPIYHQPGTSTTYTQAGSGAVWLFNRLAVSTPSPNRALVFYASEVAYPGGESIGYTYDTASPGLPFGQILYRPTRLTSNFGYYIEIKYHGTDPNTSEWGMVREAAIYASSAPTTPLGRFSYSGATITDHGARAYSDPGGRTYTCEGCPSGLGMQIEVDTGSTQLPDEGSPALQVAAQPGTTVVGSVTRDGVPWTYSYDNLRLQQGTLRYIFDQLIVNGPDGFHQVYDVANRYHGIHDIAAKRVHTTITRATDSLNRATSFYYDGYDRPLRIVYPELNEVSVLYDFNGNITSRTTTPKPGMGSPITEEADYPTIGCAGVLCWRPLRSRDGLGRQTDYAHNGAGQLTEQVDPADANGVRRRTSITYESSTGGRRRLVRICSDTAATCGADAPIQTEYQYSPGNYTNLPNLERRIDASSGTAVTLDTTYSYNAAGRLTSTDGPLAGEDDTTHYRYDEYGRRTWEIGGVGPDGVRIATRTAYRDSDDKVLSTETGTIPNASSTDLTLVRRTDLVYDDRRNPVRESVSAYGTTYSVAQRSFDDRGQLECEARRMNPAIFASLPAGACTPGAQGTGVNDFGPDRITRNVHDAAGQRLQLREGVGSAIEGAEATWDYNFNGQVTTMIDGNGNRTALRYDGHGRQDRWTFPSPTPRPPTGPGAYDDSTPASALDSAGAVNAADYEEYAYDAVGNRTSLRKRDGSTLTYQYDALNRMIVKVVPERAGLAAAHTRDVHYGYDISGLQLFARFDSPSGEGLTFTYDGFGRRLTEASPLGTMTSTWDAGGRRTRLTGPAGYWVGFERVATGQVSRLVMSSNDPLASFYYDGLGRRDYQYLLNGASATWIRDPLDRLTQLAVIVAPPNNFTLDFTYNPASGIATNTRSKDAYAWSGHYAVNRNYTTNGLNQYSAAGAASFGYDFNGNLTSDGTRTFTYDIENRLVTASPNVTLTYDPLGRLSQVATAGGATRRFAYDGDALIDEFDGSGNLKHVYLHGPNVDEPLMWWDIAAGTFGTYHADERGSIVALANNGGTATALNRYDEYGVPAATNAGAFQYTGQRWLPELGMYYYKARIYSPTLGRFLQTDPVGYEDQFNLYAYVGNDPVNAVDASGAYKCTGSKPDCQRIAGHVSQIRQAAQAAAQMTGTRIMSNDARALAGLSGFIGQEGQNNGVEIESGELPDGVYGTNGFGSNGSVRLMIDLANIDADGESATGTIAHEGTHGIQLRAFGRPTPGDTYFREYIANTMESLVYQYLGRETSLWSRAMSPQERIRRIGLAAGASCRYSRRQASPIAAARYTCPD